jgi:hypothetical protein
MAPVTPSHLSSRPPPYADSASATATPSAPRGSQAPPAILGPTAHQFLIDEGLGEHADAISLICRLFSPIKWALEVGNLATFPENAKAGLLAALEEDGGHNF